MLPRCVDRTDEQQIGIATRSRPIVKQRDRAAKGVGLEVDHQAPPRIGGASRCQGCLHFGGVMGVIVNHRHAACLAL